MAQDPCRAHPLTPIIGELCGRCFELALLSGRVLAARMSAHAGQLPTSSRSAAASTRCPPSEHARAFSEHLRCNGERNLSGEGEADISKCLQRLSVKIFGGLSVCPSITVAGIARSASKAGACDHHRPEGALGAETERGRACDPFL